MVETALDPQFTSAAALTRIPEATLRAAIDFARSRFYGDGDEGDAVTVLCAEMERRLDGPAVSDLQFELAAACERITELQLKLRDTVTEHEQAMFEERLGEEA